MNFSLLEKKGWEFVGISGEQAISIVEECERFVPEIQRWQAPSIKIASRKLSFYTDYELLRLSDDRSKSHVVWGLYATGDFWPLDGSRHNVYHVNRVSPVRLDEETVDEYVVFLKAAVLPYELPNDTKTAATDAGFSVYSGKSKILAIDLTGKMLPDSGESERTWRYAVSVAPTIPRVRPILDVKRWVLLPDTSEEKKVLLNDWSSSEIGKDNSGLLIRCAGVSFYKKHKLYEVLNRQFTDTWYRQSYLLHQPGSVLPLDGSSIPIHRVNSEETPLFASETPDEDVKDYLRFFSSAIRGEHGRFLIVERFRAIPWRKAPSEQESKITLKNLSLTKEKTEAGNTWKLVANVVYGNALFEAEFSVSTSGSVEMKSDKPIASQLSLLDPEAIETEPTTYLDQYLKKGDRQKRSAAELLTEMERPHAGTASDGLPRP